MKKLNNKLGPTPEEIDAALEEHNLHEEWLENDSLNLEALRVLLDREMSDNRDEE